MAIPVLKAQAVNSTCQVFHIVPKCVAKLVGGAPSLFVLLVLVFSLRGEFVDLQIPDQTSVDYSPTETYPGNAVQLCLARQLFYSDDVHIQPVDSISF